MTATDLSLSMACDELALANERIASLEADVETYRTMVQILLTELQSEKHLTARLMFRLRQPRG